MSNQTPVVGVPLALARVPVTDSNGHIQVTWLQWLNKLQQSTPSPYPSLPPSGAHGLVAITTSEDPGVPSGCVRFSMYRESLQYQNISNVEMRISASLPIFGPYEVERSAYPAYVIESGTLTAINGKSRMRVSRVSNPSVVSDVLVVWKPGSDPDSTLRGSVIESEGTDDITVTSPFSLGTGTPVNYSYAILLPWWDIVTWYRRFPIGQIANTDSPIWTLPDIPAPTGTWYATAATR